nr:ATP-binding protein [Micromonospora provocatoris]
MKPPSLVGRDTTAGQLRAIAEGIADPADADEHAGVVLVSGAPGVGKSSFSVTSGYDLADLFPDVSSSSASTAATSRHAAAGS